MAFCGLALGILKASQRQFHTTIRSAWPAYMQPWRGLSSDSLKPPKKPLSSFFLFMQEKKPETQRNNPDISAMEVSKVLGAQWRIMSEQDKKPYQDRSATELARWLKENETFMESLTEEEKLKLEENRKKHMDSIKQRRKKKLEKQLEKPKGPPGAFFLFCQDHKTTERGDAPLTDFVRGMGERWRRMAVEDKQVYVDQAAELRSNYEKVLLTWEDRMLEEGHPELVRVTHRPKVPKPRKRKVKKVAKKVTKKATAKSKRKKKTTVKSKGKKKTTSSSAKSNTPKKGTKSEKSIGTQTEDASWMREE